jgi:bifunctional DNA-binding transcriptional regulator/antitoxin component of YhaV-PrlF toxin-antitoxin module
MIHVLVEEGFRLTVPKELRDKIQVGDKMLVDVDRTGRIVLLSEERVRATLARTAGLWRGRRDIPSNGVKYVNRLRRGTRLHRLGVIRRAAH